MPAMGDQHRAGAGGNSVANPFDEPKPRMSEYTAQEIATLQSRLDKQLGPEYISSRAGPGGKKVHYLAAEKVIGLANEVFGFNGWSSSIQNIQIDFVEENPTTGKIRLGLSVIVRVTLKDGTFHEDIGYGQIENCPGKAAAFEKCKKEGTTDGLKRALRSFGNVLGNCIYDKEYLQRVTKLKPDPCKWTADNLHRHSDYGPVKKEPREEKIPRITADSGEASYTEPEDEFGDGLDEADFSERHHGNPDEVVLEAEPAGRRPLQNGHNKPTRTESRNPPANPNSAATPSKPPRPPENDQADRIERQRQLAIERRNAALAAQKMQPPNNVGAGTRQAAAAPMQQQDIQQHSSSPGMTSQHFQPQDELALQPIPFKPMGEDAQPGHTAPVGFFSARAVVPEGSNIKPVPVTTFNPHAESPSIRKTAGIDHSRSGKVLRESLEGQPVQPADPRPLPNPAPPSRDFVNPSADMNRRIGAPAPGFSSPGMTTKSFRPVTFKRPADGPAQTNPPAQRQPLGDVGNVVGQPNTGFVSAAAAGTEAKKPRVAAPPGNGPENVQP